VVGNDSGLANIAASLGVATICPYGPTDPTLTGPALLGAHGLHVTVPCGPCFDDRQDATTARACSHRRCLGEVSAESVAELLDTLTP